MSLVAGCGRGKNMLGTLDDGTKFCCRYRDLQWRETRGELYSYHLNSLLGLHNAPPAALLRVNFSSPLWRGSAAVEAARGAGWAERAVIAVTLYVEGVVSETFPPALTKGKRNSLVTQADLESASSSSSSSKGEESRLLQWSDLIVFDFVSGHSDRIFNSLFNLRWNRHMMERPVHNLLKTERRQKLLLFDNESGFWQGYRMASKDREMLEMQERFLRKLCVFRERTLRQVEYLLHGDSRDSDDVSPSQRFEAYIKRVDPVSFEMVEPLSREERREFESRLKQVMEQVEKCRTL